ncbi:hypothetical protein ARTHRO8AJ_10050 [Arthrobacter sp. 8AJ]|nr:hypothetical protein ARTHRO8AJ_10050 [Arthrobacter sp. 8AJ]
MHRDSPPGVPQRVGQNRATRAVEPITPHVFADVSRETAGVHHTRAPTMYRLLKLVTELPLDAWLGAPRIACHVGGLTRQDLSMGHAGHGSHDSSSGRRLGSAASLWISVWITESLCCG